MVPTEDKIEDAVKKLRRNRSGGGVRDAVRAPERVNRGVQQGERGGGEGRREDRGGGGRRGTLGKIVDLIQKAFHEGGRAEEATWQTVVLIPKGRK